MKIWAFAAYLTKTNGKELILSFPLLSAIVLGVVGLVSEIKAEKGDKVFVQATDNTQKKEQLKSRETVFSDFTAYGCFEENDDLIGRDIKFRLNGVNVNVKLIKLNKKTREFNSTFVKGTLYQNKVEVIVTEDEINDHLVRYSADNVEKTNDKILLKGNALLTSNQNDSIKAEEIIISLQKLGKISDRSSSICGLLSECIITGSRSKPGKRLPIGKLNG